MRILVCFFKILKKKRGYIFMYLGIFFSIAIAMFSDFHNSFLNLLPAKTSRLQIRKYRSVYLMRTGPRSAEDLPTFSKKKMSG